MEVDEQSALGLRKALIHDEGSTQLGDLRIDNSVPCSELMDVDQSRTSRDMDDSQLLGGSDSVTAEGADDRAGGAPLAEIEVKVRAEENDLGTRRRGRPPRGQQKATPIPRKSISSDEEDVCFICFDGGSLVLCDRRGCPKAYHPACVKRDEAFFRSKAKWNCGWHICSSCQKASHYMCYTCTYSLCKGCIKDADYQCVRGSKGLCGTCMRTIMLLEKSLPRSEEHSVQVDFDDKSSWEYLFKTYWVYLKQKLSLTLDDLIGAKNPWNGGGTVDPNGESVGNCHDANNGKNCRIDSAGGGAIAANSKRKTLKRQQNIPSRVNSTNDKITLSIEGNFWATKELLEFVAYARNGDTTALSQFGVQSLVLEYIKENNLCDPQLRSHIICDRMLMTLFGKQRVGHFEMLKLLEYHFHTNESSSAVDRNSKVLDVVAGHVEEKGNDSYQLITDSDRKRKTRRKADDRRRQMNPDEYAAIDVHNINLIYLSRNLIESIMGDTENFRDKVVDSFVRIQISNSDQKPDVYRLVQVVGTSKSSEPYVIGEKTADVMLDVLNIDKKEAVSIEGISNQEFSEDECRRLHESVKCGLLKRFTVGEIQKKAMALQALKVNDRLESEILRLNHLRDRASEKGLKKELRECVEKLQLLNSPEERQRRIVEIPEIHADPTLDPSFVSDNLTKELNKSKQGTSKTGIVTTRRRAGQNRRVRRPDPCREPDHPAQGNSQTLSFNTNNVSSGGFKRAYKTGSGRKCGGRDLSIDSRSRIENRPANTSGQQICTANHLNNPISIVIGTGSNPISNGIEHSNDIDMDKIWHYQDPAGKIQGPFSMSRLQKWSSSGHFPPHLRVWRISEMPGDSILLTDAMKGQYGKNSVQIREEVGLGLCSDDDNQPNDEWSRNRHSNESGSPTDCSLPADGVNSSEFRQKGFEQRTAKEDRGHSCEKRSDSDGCSGQSSGQNWRPLPANATQDSRSGGIALSDSIEPQNQNFDFPDLPSPTPAKTDVGLTGQAVEIKQSASSRFLIQDSVPSWSTGSSLVGGRKHLPVYSPTPAKASAEEWDSSLITSTSLKPAEFISDCAATPASVNDRLTHSSPSHPASNISVWPEIIEPNEFNSLGDESFSDLLAEVEAMESLSELASSTSIMNCRDDLTQGCKIDCFSSVGGLSPTPEMGRGDALSSTGDGQVPAQSTITDKSHLRLHMFDIDLQMKVGGHSSTTVEVDINNKYDNVATNQWTGGTGMKISTHLSAALTMETAENPWRIGSEATDASWGSADIGWGGINGGNSNSSREIRPESIQEMGSMNSGTSAGYNTTNWYDQLKYGFDRLSSPRDNGRGRYFWDKQPVFGGGNQIGLSRPPPRGQGQ